MEAVVMTLCIAIGLLIGAVLYIAVPRGWR